MKKTRSEFEVECFANVVNSISRVLYHVLVDNEYTASRWDKSDNSEIKEYIKERIDIYPKAVFRPIIMDFDMYITFSIDTPFAKFEPGVFKNDRGTLFINFPVDIDNPDADIYECVRCVFEDLFSILLEEDKDYITDIAVYHTRLLIENNKGKNTIDHVEKVLKEVDVWDSSKKFPCVVPANYMIAIHELFRHYKTYTC